MIQTLVYYNPELQANEFVAVEMDSVGQSRALGGCT
jgi:hypothetical protein